MCDKCTRDRSLYLNVEISFMMSVRLVTQNKNIGFIAGHSEISRHIFQLTILGDKIDRARPIFHLFGDKIDRLRSFCPFLEAKIEKKCHFYLLFGYKTGRKRRESRKKWKKSRAKAGGLSILSPNAPKDIKLYQKSRREPEM